MTGLPAALYEPIADGYAATALTRGPWNAGHQHAGPPAALLAREVERAGAIAGGQIARIAFDILAPVPIAPLGVAARVVRPGRRVELVEAQLIAPPSQEVLMRASAWRMRSEAARRGSQVAGVSGQPPPAGPETGREPSFSFWRDEVAYKDALEWRFVEGEFDRPGPATVWTRLRVPLVAGGETAPLEALLVMADAASGASAALDWQRWVFANVDLVVSLARPPRGGWMAMAAHTDIGPTGIGLCRSTLFDADGAVGASAQSLLVAQR